ncbi:hypothetical protein [Hymenobacter norwichensis]|uniref:hypothetical protein n=1 Tax=Hymenobacter norwichensis TaxID=223903 RepID=UPI0003B32CC7|nr:hypothetical protein [Hymenobacter norwichensis]
MKGLFYLTVLAGIGFAGPRLVGPSPAATTAAELSSITLLTLNQPPCVTLTPQSVLRAKVAYRLADGEQSAYGFAVSIKFQSTDPRRTFSNGREGIATVTQRADTLTITYPMAALRQNAQLQRPVTCYFYLHRYTDAGRSLVIAKTPPITFQEYQ